MKTKKTLRGNVSRNKNLPATMGMLYEVRDSLRSDFLSLEHRLDGLQSGQKSLENGQRQLESRMDFLNGHLESRMDSLSGHLESRMDSLSERLQSRMDSLNEQLQSRMNSLSEQLDTRLNAQAETFNAGIHRLALLMEEQNARNKFVLDKLVFTSDKVDRLEVRTSRLEKLK